MSSMQGLKRVLQVARDRSRVCATCCARLTAVQAAAESCGAADKALLVSLENECVYENYIKREDKDAVQVHRNMEAALPDGFEYQVTCDL